MFFVVLGHFSHSGLNDFIYSFNVPVFFIISGFLFKDISWDSFWEKNMKSMVIPYSLLCATVIVYFFIVKAYFGGLEWDYLPSSVISCVLGSQNGIGTGIGSLGMWFVYTLLLAKVLANFIQQRWFIQSIICICFLMGAAFLSYKEVHLYSSYANLLVSYPFFVIGYYMRNVQKEALLSFFKKIKIHPLFGLFLTVICVLVCFCVGKYNGMAQMYDAHFGNNIFLFLLGGVIGTVMLAIPAVLLEKSSFASIISTYSKGTIIILAWQFCFILIIDIFFKHFIGDSIHNDWVAIGFSVFVYASFLPIIRLVMKYIPALVGYRKF